MSKVIDSMWFNTAQGSFGIILAEDETTGERKLYAGVAAGFDQQADERAILSWGNKVNLGMLGGLLARAEKARKAGGHIGQQIFKGLDNLIYPDTSGKYVEFSFPLKEAWLAFRKKWDV